MADQNFMDLASKTASGIGGTDYMMLVNNSEAYKALVNDVAEAILSKLTSKSFSGLETTAKNVIGALNELNSKTNSGLIPKRIPSADLNNAYSSNAGITVYVCVPSDANIPKSETGFVISIKFDTSASLQLYIALNSAVIYKRAQTGRWSEW